MQQLRLLQTIAVDNWHKSNFRYVAYTKLLLKQQIITLNLCGKNITVKLNFRPNKIIGVVIATIAIGFRCTLSLAESKPTENIFSCDTTSKSTVVKTATDTMWMMTWANRAFDPNVSPKQLCRLASTKLQQFHNKGTLKYIKADTVNKLPVICIASYAGGSCLPNGILATLKPNTDANNTFIEILNRRTWGLFTCISFSHCPQEQKIIFETNGNIHFDLELFLKKINS